MKPFATFAMLWLTLLPALSHAADTLAPSSSLKGSPRSVPYYDLRWAKALTLQDMQAKEVYRERKDGVEVIALTYSAFEQPFASDGGGVKTLPWRQKAVLFLPLVSREAADQITQAVLFNVHDSLNWKDDETLQYGGNICRAFVIPVLIHGWETDVVMPLQGRSYGDTQVFLFNQLLQAKIEKAEDLPMDGRYLVNGLPLTKGDMVSITLLQRLAASERGINVKEVGSLGISKEGWAHWILAAVDDRVAVVAPGGHYLESYRDALECYRTDWGGQYPAHLGNAELFQAVFRLGDRLLTTEAGKKVDQTMSPEHWPGLLHARHVLVCGDLGQHDGPFPVLAENSFLAKFPHPSWRYVRAFKGGGLSDLENDMSASLLPHVADLLLFGSTTPTTPEITVEETGRRIKVKARCRTSPDLKTEALVVYTISPERSLRTAKSSWKTAAMIRRTEDGELESPLLPDVPPKNGITFLVIVRELVERAPIHYWRSASSLPQEHFPLPKHEGKMPSWKETP